MVATDTEEGQKHFNIAKIFVFWATKVDPMLEESTLKLRRFLAASTLTFNRLMDMGGLAGTTSQLTIHNFN